VHVADGSLTVAVQTEGFSHPVRIGLGDEVRELGAGQEWTVPLGRDGRVAPGTGAASASVTAGTDGVAGTTGGNGDGPLQSSSASGEHDHGGNGA
jgi:hypothetical protein